MFLRWNLLGSFKIAFAANLAVQMVQSVGENLVVVGNCWNLVLVASASCCCAFCQRYKVRVSETEVFNFLASYLSAKFNYLLNASVYAFEKY